VHAIVWSYRVRPEAEPEFVEAYRAGGAWAKLFERADGYLGTELFRDQEASTRFLTIDRWRSPADFEAFKARFGEAYSALDRTLEGLTLEETRLGTLVP
jgi:heme-degrading monooxygenase HmoA